MLDIKFVRENPDVVDKSCASRQNAHWDRERFFELDEERIPLLFIYLHLLFLLPYQSGRNGRFCYVTKRPSHLSGVFCFSSAVPDPLAFHIR